jgi:hypothetical protein
LASAFETSAGVMSGALEKCCSSGAGGEFKGGKKWEIRALFKRAADGVLGKEERVSVSLCLLILWRAQRSLGCAVLTKTF